MSTLFAMQTIHGRAAAIATGLKVANPKTLQFGKFLVMVMVWLLVVITFIHALRRNIDY